jgi:hypothetical protein
MVCEPLDGNGPSCVPWSSPTIGRWVRVVCLVLIASLSGLGAAAGQDSNHEFWPETDIWLRVSPAWRASLFVPLSKNIETNYREGSLILQADYAFGTTHNRLRRRLLDENRAQAVKLVLVRSGYLVGRSLDDGGQAYNEDTAFLEMHVRIPLKGAFLLSHRLRADLRWLGEDSTFSNRWRYRLQLEKDFALAHGSFVPYVNAEPYYDSRYATVNRLRLIAGTSVAWWARWALEGNFTYQHDSEMSPTVLHAVNVIVHIFFEIPRNQ